MDNPSIIQVWTMEIKGIFTWRVSPFCHWVHVTSLMSVYQALTTHLASSSPLLMPGVRISLTLSPHPTCIGETAPSHLVAPSSLFLIQSPLPFQNQMFLSFFNCFHIFSPPFSIWYSMHKSKQFRSSLVHIMVKVLRIKSLVCYKSLVLIFSISRSK